MAGNDRLTLLDYKIKQGKIGVINATVPKLDAEIIVFSDTTNNWSKVGKHDNIEETEKNRSYPAIIQQEHSSSNSITQATQK